jgi:hypothetical protein
VRRARPGRALGGVQIVEGPSRASGRNCSAAPPPRRVILFRRQSYLVARRHNQSACSRDDNSGRPDGQGARAHNFQRIGPRCWSRQPPSPINPGRPSIANDGQCTSARPLRLAEVCETCSAAVIEMRRRAPARPRMCSLHSTRERLEPGAPHEPTAMPVGSCQEDAPGGPPGPGGRRQSHLARPDMFA